MPEQDRREESERWRLLAWGAVCVVLLLMILALLTTPLLFLSRSAETSVALRNRGTETIESVWMVLDYHGIEGTEQRWDELGAGEERAIRPKKKDLTVSLSYVLNGRKHTHEEGVDLWTGETFAFEVQPDGTVRSGYDYGKGIGD